MKKFAAFLLMLTLGLFTIGCGPTETPEEPADDSTTMDAGDDTSGDDTSGDDTSGDDTSGDDTSGS